LLEDYFIDYGKQDRKPGEVLWRIDIPKLKSNERFFAHKLSKRFDQDISAVLAAFKFVITGRVIGSATLPLAAWRRTPRRARKDRRGADRDLKLDAPELWEDVADARKDFTPIRHACLRCISHGSGQSPSAQGTS
jgi:xanthine dehydrogenase small subunit